MRQLIEDLISAMEYHVEQTRPIHSTTVALQAAREALRAQPAPVQEPEWKQIAEDLRFHGLTLVKTATGYAVLKLGAVQAQATPPAQPAPVQEPVAWIADTKRGYNTVGYECKKVNALPHGTMLYTTPPAAQRQWVSLTDEEIIKAMPGGIYDCLNDPWDCGVGDGDTLRSIKKDVLRIARAIETKLKEKNNG
jgi:hypothetical protein